jgi:hypothetical protein
MIPIIIFLLSITPIITFGADDTVITFTAEIVQYQAIKDKYPDLIIVGASGLALASDNKKFSKGEIVWIKARRQVLDDLKEKKFIHVHAVFEK